MGKKACFSALGTLAFLGSLAGFWLPSAYAEGSRDLVNSGGSRPFLEFSTGSNGGILRRTTVKVYVNVGETIDLGSSAVGVGGGIINYRRADNTAGTCGAQGLIADRAQEVAGPGNGSGGTFIPCPVSVAAGQGGIWEIDFVSPDINGAGVTTPILGTGNWTQPAGVNYVSAWDVTVRSSSGTAIPGRVYTNYFALNMGNNNQSLSSLLYVLTKEGYRYSIDLNGLDPFGFIFFANRNGFIDLSTGDPIFRSLQFTGANPGGLPPGYSFQNPNAPDSATEVTHKLFINTPDASMPGTASSPTGPTWLYSLPLPPPAPTNFKFTGIEGTSNQSGTSPLGGTLTFDSPVQSSFSLTLDLNSNGIYGDSNDRTFLGRAVVGANSVFWDGLDGNGVAVPASSTPYNVRANLYGGEAHFPMIDAEQNNNGIIVFRQNQPAGPTSVSDNPYNVYYDDRNTGGNFTLCAASETTTNTGVATPVCYGGAPTPRQALTGVVSSAGAHRFTTNFGDRRGIDTWVYYPSVDVNLSGGIVVKQADLIVNKTVNLATANAGSSLTYTVSVTNNGPSDSSGIGFQDVVPATLSGVSWSCAITSGTGSCGATNGAGNAINTTLSLNNQAVATYSITGTLSAGATGSITNSATAIRNKDVTDPNLGNNTSSATTTINSAPPASGSICYLVADSNDRLVRVDINTGAEVNIGPVGVLDIEAIAYWPITNTLYAADANRLGTLNTTTGAYTNIGSFGSGSGSAGTKNFTDVDGIAFNPFTGELYGSVRDGDDVAPEDLLIKINPTTGARVANAFGPGIDYLVIKTSATTGFTEVDDIAFDPTTGFLYGIANQGSTSADKYVRINPADGTTTLVGGFGVSDMEGLTAFNDGSFYGSTGDAGSVVSARNSFYRVNKTTGQATKISQLSIGADYESITCLTGPPNRITGTVFLDPDLSGTLNAGDSGTLNAAVRLYRDSNGNGLVDGADILITTQNSASNGTFNFLFASNGAFVLDVNPATLPPTNNVFTTDNIEVADFGTSLNVTDANNNFGHYTRSNLAIVKRITAINGVQLPDSVDNLSSPDDNHPNWPSGLSGAGISTFLAGAIQKNVEPGDVVEYTIYYLATGNAPVTNVKLCDRVPPNTTYIPNSTVLFTSGNTTNLTDTNGDSDGGEFLPSGNNTAVPCPGLNSNGTALVNLAPSPSQLPNATGPGTPLNSYGFIRFRVTVN
jgi:uncharacterized repeat protein (TIGR01451 family)